MITKIIKYRGLPDVSGNADPNTGYKIFMDKMEYVIGGTSAVAPLFAGLNARLNEANGKSIGFFNTKFYNQFVFNDITFGKNDYYNATSGWDFCTGLGSPNGLLMLAVLQKIKQTNIRKNTLILFAKAKRYYN